MMLGESIKYCAGPILLLEAAGGDAPPMPPDASADQTTAAMPDSQAA
jgi:hypothetical protein